MPFVEHYEQFESKHIVDMTMTNVGTENKGLIGVNDIKKVAISAVFDVEV